jgi:hypothetical protein
MRSEPEVSPAQTAQREEPQEMRVLQRVDQGLQADHRDERAMNNDCIAIDIL